MVSLNNDQQTFREGRSASKLQDNWNIWGQTELPQISATVNQTPAYLSIKAAINHRAGYLKAVEGIESVDAAKLLAAAVDVFCWQKACTLEEMLDYINQWRPVSC